jgi:hypothetical protein
MEQRSILEKQVYGPKRSGTKSHPAHRKATLAKKWHRNRKLRLLYFQIQDVFLAIEVGLKKKK